MNETNTCETCQGRGIVGGICGQTAESYEEVIEDCPDCSGGEPLKTVECKCIECGWIDDFDRDSLNIEQMTDGFCEDCDQPRIFSLI